VQVNISSKKPLEKTGKRPAMVVLKTITGGQVLKYEFWPGPGPMGESGKWRVKGGLEKQGRIKD
jgi:hypothetical protein